jgi:hypothetical protein
MSTDRIGDLVGYLHSGLCAMFIGLYIFVEKASDLHCDHVPLNGFELYSTLADWAAIHHVRPNRLMSEETRINVMLASVIKGNR